MSNSITPCERLIASSLPCASPAMRRAGVMSVANLTILIGLPVASKIGLYEAWIHTSWPLLATRRYSPASNSPRPRRSQNATYSGERVYSGSQNMRWWLPTTSDSS